MFNNNVMKNVLNVSLPIIFEMTIYTFINILDIMMIGNYGGNKAVSAVGISSEIIYSCVNTFIAVGMGLAISALVAQSVGAANKKCAEQFASLGFLIGFFISGGIFFVIYYFSKEILYIAGARNDVLIIGNVFVKIFLISSLFNMLVILINSILRGYGNTYIPLVIAIVIAIVKILLDWMLIFGHAFKSYGIIGAAYASIVAQFIGLTIALYYIFFKSKIKIKFKYMIFIQKDKLKEILKLFIPSFMDDAVFNASRLICTFIIMKTGSIAFAANQIANTVEAISIMPGIGLGMAATTLVGIKVGEKNYKTAKDYTYCCAFCAVLMMSIFSIIFLTSSRYLVKLFVGDNEREVIKIAAICLWVGAFEQPFIAISYSIAGAMEGFKDAKTPFIVSLISSWLIRFPFILYFIYFKKSFIVTVWWITLLQWSIDGIMIFIFFKKKFRDICYGSY